MDFSKLFGGKGSSDGTNAGGSDRSSKGKAIYDFDPTGLERAAKSAHQLKDHPNASKILDVAIAESQNKRLEILKDQKAYELKIEHAKMEGVKQQHDYAVEILKEEAKTHRTKAEYEDFLARKRQEDRLQMEKASQLELLKIQEDSIKRQEELRRNTIDYEFSKRKDNEKELSAVFWKNKSTYKKDTKDITLAKYAMRMESQFKKSQMIVSSVGSMVASGLNSFYENKQKFIAFTCGVCILTAGLVLSKRGSALALKKLESYLFTPKLIKELKKMNSYRIFTTFKKDSLANLQSNGLIYNAVTEETLSDIVSSTKNSLYNKGFLRNFLFHGPPGTGKTLFAKKLALNSGLDYAILSGGDVVPLKEKAVTELHKVFDWSSRSRGLILFLDEADAFLKQRERANMGEEMRSALNSFLYRTGESSKNLMLILATNKPEHLDRAVTDRIDMMVEFQLPDKETRRKLINYYFDLRFKNNPNIVGFNLEDIMDELIINSKDFSAREIAKLTLSWQVSAFANTQKTISSQMIMESLKSMQKQHTTKQSWDTWIDESTQRQNTNYI